jgi:hypothetical protein
MRSITPLSEMVRLQKNQMHKSMLWLCGKDQTKQYAERYDMEFWAPI